MKKILLFENFNIEAFNNFKKKEEQKLQKSMINKFINYVEIFYQKI